MNGAALWCLVGVCGAFVAWLVVHLFTRPRCPRCASRRTFEARRLVTGSVWLCRACRHKWDAPI